VASGVGESALLDEVEAAFDAMVPVLDPGAPSKVTAPPTLEPSSSLVDLHELFTALAANYMSPVREFMIAVQWGQANRSWIAVCEPAVTSLLRAAKQMELPELCSALESFVGELHLQDSRSNAPIAGETRDKMLASYAKLVALFPDVFSLERERGRREAIIVHSLLKQVPEVSKLTIDKLYAAGINSLDMMFVATPGALSETTGIGDDVAQAIVERFQRYRVELRVVLAGETRTIEKERLTRLCSDLRRLCHQYEEVADDGSDTAHARKKQIRRARNEALLQVNVVLARLGEIERIAQIERLPIVRKLEQVERFLREAVEPAVPEVSLHTPSIQRTTTQEGLDG
jgi:hypothetical protein